MIPQVGDAGFQTNVELRVDDQEMARQSAGIGTFRILAPVAEGAGVRRVQVRFSAAQRLPGGDGRLAAARLQSLGFEPATGPADIVQGPGIQLGSNWGDLETFHNETFRWVENDAQILLTPASSGEERVSLQVEPGPGVGDAFLLKARDATGKQVDVVRVEHRATVDLFLPVDKGKANEFRLHVDGGGKRATTDPRILNFRVFHISGGPWHSRGR